jgi:hypothetical protein
MKKVFFVSSLLMFSISSLIFKEQNFKSSEVSKQTYLNFTFDSIHVSCNDIAKPIAGGDYTCRRVKTIISSSRFGPNGSSFLIKVVLPQDPLLMDNYPLNKKYEISSNGYQSSMTCPLMFGFRYRPDKNSDFGYNAIINSDTTYQFVRYTKLEKGKPEPGMKRNYYLSGYFQCKVQEGEDRNEVGKFMKGDFRIRVCFE